MSCDESCRPKWIKTTFPFYNKTVFDKRQAKRKQLARMGFFQHWAKLWELYTNSTSLHGIKYAREPYIPRVGKLIWLVFFLGAMGISVYMAEQVYQKFHSAPIITSLKTVDYKLETEPFPAITICNMNEERRNITQNVAPIFPKWENNSTCMKDVLPKILLLMESFWAPSLTTKSFSQPQLYELERSLTVKCNMTREDLHELLIQASVLKRKPTFSWVSHHATNKSLTKDVPMRLESDVVLTNHGTCFSANYYKLVDSVLKIDQAGFNTGMRVTHCNATSTRSTRTSTYHQGNVLVLLHDPHDLPDLFLERPNVVSVSELASLSFKVTKISATPALAKVALTKRNCVLPTDQPRIELLNLTESLGNCYSNCMARYMMQHCGCLPYFYIGLLKQGITYENCSISSYICLTTVSYEVRSNLSACDCYPNCNTVRYDPDVWFQTLSGAASRVSNCAEIKIFARTMRGYEFEIDVRYGWEDLMAAIGGLLGLGVGFSFISFLELVYFFCCHWWLEYFGRAPRKKSRNSEQDSLRPRRATKIHVLHKTRY